MDNDRRDKAWALYKDYHQDSSLLSDELFVNIWDHVSAPVYAWVKRTYPKKYQYELVEDLLADSKLEIWLAIRDRSLPADNSKRFMGALFCIVKRCIIGEHRKRTSAAKVDSKYTENRPKSYECCPTTELWVSKLHDSKVDLLAEAMVQRSRFQGVVTESLCRRVVLLLEKAVPLGMVLEVVESTGFWDPGFLLEHLQVLYRWAFHDLRKDAIA